MSLRDAGLRALHPGQGTPLTTPLFILGSEKRGFGGGFPRAGPGGSPVAQQMGDGVITGLNSGLGAYREAASWA